VHLFATLNDSDEVDEGSPLIIRQRHRLSVRYPQMNSATTRVHPEQMLVPKLLPYGRVEHTDRSADEAPAMFADIRTRTACSDTIVVRHIDVKYELPLNGSKRARPYGFLVPRLEKKMKMKILLSGTEISSATEGLRDTHSCRVDGTDLEASRVQRARLLFKFVCGRERVVTQIHVVLERERDLAVCEEPAGNVLVVQPFEDRLEGVKPAIECEHQLRSWRLYLCGRHGGLGVCGVRSTFGMRNGRD
jgi:hypothetical protein